MHFIPSLDLQFVSGYQANNETFQWLCKHEETIRKVRVDSNFESDCHVRFSEKINCDI